MKTIGLAPNPAKKEAVQLTGELADWLEARQIRVVVAEEVAASIGKAHIGTSEEQVVQADLLLVLGGDGTMLRWSRMAAPMGTPMMGINFGQYGFITEIHPNQAKVALTRILEGDYCVSERVVLKAKVTRDGQEIGAYHALNDAVVSKGAIARMLALRTFVNGRYIVTYQADGIIVATPTGSTAYSMSAGGPVVYPSVCALVVTPVCPHTLNARSLIVPDSEIICIAGDTNSEEIDFMLTTDGQIREHLTRNDVVEISKADFMAKLVQLEPDSFYSKLQNRLRWGERFSGER